MSPTVDEAALRRQLDTWLAGVERLAHAGELRLLRDRRVPRLDRLCQTAARRLPAPRSAVTLLEAGRQLVVAEHGQPVELGVGQGTPLERSYCQLVGATGAACRIRDAREHPVVRELTDAHALGSIAYLGTPVRDPAGNVVASFCAVDVEPREWTDRDVELMHDLSVVVQAVIATECGWLVEELKAGRAGARIAPPEEEL